MPKPSKSKSKKVPTKVVDRTPETTFEPPDEFKQIRRAAVDFLREVATIVELGKGPLPLAPLLEFLAHRSPPAPPSLPIPSFSSPQAPQEFEVFEPAPAVMEEAFKEPFSEPVDPDVWIPLKDASREYAVKFKLTVGALASRVHQRKLPITGGPRSKLIRKSDFQALMAEREETGPTGRWKKDSQVLAPLYQAAPSSRPNALAEVEEEINLLAPMLKDTPPQERERLVNSWSERTGALLVATDIEEEHRVQARKLLEQINELSLPASAVPLAEAPVEAIPPVQKPDKLPHKSSKRWLVSDKVLKLTKGRRLLIAGGKGARPEHQRAYMAAFLPATIEWATSESSHSWVRMRERGGYDIVLYLTGYSSHESAAFLRDCKKAAVPVAYVKGGYSVSSLAHAIEEQLAVGGSLPL